MGVKLDIIHGLQNMLGMKGFQGKLAARQCLVTKGDCSKRDDGWCPGYP